MAFFKASGGNKVESIRLVLSESASGSARHQGDDSHSAGSVSGSGSYTLNNMYIDRVVGVSGSMTLSYTNSQGTTTSVGISTGTVVNIENNNGITISWSSSSSFDGHGDSGKTIGGSVAVDIYF